MEEIYRKYSKLIYKYIYSLSRDHELSEELMQDTFCSAIKGIENFKGDSSIYSWLCGIAKNKWKDYVSKNMKIQTIPFDNSIENWLIEDNLEGDMLSETEKIVLYEKIRSLEEITRELIYLRIKSELSFKEIGKILNKSEIWARINFYRAKLKLKEELENEKRM